MINRFKVFAIILLAPVFAWAQNPVKTLPDFVFFRLDKTPFNKAAMAHGRKTLFVFFDSDCEHCQHAAQNLQQHYKAFNGASIYLVTLDDKLKIKSFMNKNCPTLLNKPNVIILQDLDNEFISRFNPRKYPSMLLYSAGGNLLAYQDDDTKMDVIFTACKNPPNKML
jgi:thiol-disulfide isomerase/thioredoxin